MGNGLGGFIFCELSYIVSKPVLDTKKKKKRVQLGTLCSPPLPSDKYGCLELMLLQSSLRVWAPHMMFRQRHFLRSTKSFQLALLSRCPQTWGWELRGSQKWQLRVQGWHPPVAPVTFRRAYSSLAGRVQSFKKFSLFQPMVILVFFLH